MAELVKGIDLSGRTLGLSIPSATAISANKTIALVNSNNYIAERVVNGVQSGFVHYVDTSNVEHEDIFYSYDGNTTSVNLSEIVLPDDFGVISETDETAVLYSFISRGTHEKVYVFTEDAGKVPLEEANFVTPVEKGGTGAGTGSEGLKNLLAAGPMILSANQFGTTLPSEAPAGRLFFLKVT